MKLSLKEAKKSIKKFTSKISFDWLFDRRVLVVVSVLLAVIFWFYITLNVSPTEKKIFADVPVTIDAGAIDAKGLTLLDIMDTSVLGDTTYTVPVEVEGNRYSLTQLNREDISVVAQLTNVIENQPNNYTLALKTTCTNNLYDVTVESQIESITVKLDVITSKTYPIKTKSNSTASAKLENYSMESPATYIGNEKISEVEIKGPQAVINRIAKVEVFAEGAQNLTQTTDFAGGKFILYDEDDVQIDSSDLEYVTVTAIEEQYENVSINSAAVTVRVPLRVNATAKIVALFDESRVGEDFNWSKLKKLISIKPSSTIDIKYIPDINKDDPVNDIVKTLEQKTGRIDLSVISTDTNVYYETIKLPSGVEFTGGLTGNQLDIEVHFDLSGYIKRTFTVAVDESNFICDFDSTEMRIVPSGTMNITLIGPKSEIFKINEENVSQKVTIIADASTVTTTGTISLPVNIHVKGKTNCWVIGSDEDLSLSVTVMEPAAE